MTVIVALLCLAITWTAVSKMRASEDAEVRIAFDDYCLRFTHDLNSQLASLIHLSRASAAVLEAHTTLKLKEWETYINGLDPYHGWPGFRGAGVVFVTNAVSEPTLIALLKEQGQTDFRIFPPGKSVPTGGIHFPLAYTAPDTDISRHYRGFDLGSEPVPLEAIELARDRGEPALSGPVNFSLDREATPAANDRPHLLLFAPFYNVSRPTEIVVRRTSLAGLIVIGIDIKHILEELSGGKGLQRIAVRASDLTGGKVIFDSMPTAESAQSSDGIGARRYTRIEKLGVGGRNWQLEFYSLPGFEKAIDRAQSSQLVIIGLLGTLLLSGLSFYLGSVLRKAHKHTENVTAKLSSSEVSLARYRDFLVNVLDALPDPMVVTSGDDRVRMVNRVYALKAGRTVEGLVGSSAYDLFPKEQADPFVKLNHSVLQTGESQRLEFTYFDKQMGAHRRVLTHWIRTLGPEGEMLVIATSHDVTEVRASEDRYRRLSEMASDWFWEQDAEFRFTHMTQGVRADAVDPQAFLGKHRWDMPTDLTLTQWAEHRALLESHQPFTDLEYCVTSPVGVRHWYAVSGRPMFDPAGNFTGYQGTGRDITERKVQEEELRMHRDKLSEMVDAKTVELRAAVAAAGVAMKAKSEFIANMSHELRTPLHAILSFTQLGLLRTDAAPEKAKSYFERAHQAGERLLVLINNLLDMSKIEAGKLVLDLRPNDLAQLAREIAQELEPLILQRKQSVIVPPSGFVAPANFDASRMGQAIRNLLSNAIKFTPEGKSIYVTVREDTLPQGRRSQDATNLKAAWRLSVADEGIGLPANELDAIFEKFVQSSKTRSGAGGTGLGLSITREIVEAHSGTVHAYNRIEGGSEFVLLIPQTPLLT